MRGLLITLAYTKGSSAATSSGLTLVDHRRLEAVAYGSMDEAPPDDVVFNTEAVKLLLQVAWANDELEASEREFIEKLAKAWKVPGPTLETLLAALDQGKPLPQPDLGLLRTRPEKVLRAAEALVAVDGTRDVQEDELMKELKVALGVD
jgi:tellurite resistance protein